MLIILLLISTENRYAWIDLEDQQKKMYVNYLFKRMMVLLCAGDAVEVNSDWVIVRLIAI